MGVRRFLRSVVLGTLVLWGASTGSVGVVDAEPSLVKGFAHSGDTSECGVPLAAITAMRPTLRYPDFDLALPVRGTTVVRDRLIVVKE